MDDNPWSWKVGINPYRNTPFQILALDVMVHGRGPIRRHVDERAIRVRRAPKKCLVFGEQIGEAAVVAAAKAIEDAEGRLYAELRTHRPRRVELDVRELARRLGEMQAPVGRQPLRPNAARLARLVPPPRPRQFPPLWTW